MENPLLTRLAEALADRYRIERELGHGGMATVYLAQDIRHDRHVALKLLKPELAAVIGAERFLQEIKTTANLQHPHILGLIDSGETSGLLWYVMPFVKGESLRDRLNREKQLPVEDAIRLTVEVASAVDYAHRHGVIHRDIKPENILLHDKQALVADFGIALALSSAGPSRMTEAGMSLGTPQYMSPEQAMGDRTLDARSDIYSLGAMLYEMLAGDPPYTGGTAQAIVAKVLTERVPLVTVARETVPPHIAAAITKALAKLPADRFGSAAEFAGALTDGTTAGRYSSAPSQRRSTGVPSYRLVALLGGLALVTGAAIGWLLHKVPAPRSFPAEFYVEADSTHTMELGTFVPLALSPDGTRLAYLARTTKGLAQLYERRLDELDAKPVEGTVGADHPFYSADGEWLAFDEGGFLKKVRVSGGAPSTIARISANTTGGAWGADGTIVFSSGVPRTLFRVSADGGTPERLTTADSATSENHVRPTLLPDGKTVLFTSFRSATLGARLGVFSLDTKRVKYLNVPALVPKYLDSGELLYVLDDGTLVAQRFDLKRLEVSGSVRRIADAVTTFARVAPTFDAARSGVIVYRPGGGLGTMLVSVDRQGKEQAILTAPDLWSPRYSPDGNRIAFARQGAAAAGRDIWVYSISEASTTRITHEFSNAVDPAWSPDGKQLLFSAGTAAAMALETAPSDGSVAARQVLARPGNVYQSVYTRDGKSVIFVEATAAARGDLFTASLVAGSAPVPVAKTSFDESAPALSPDGRWLAYHSDESGQTEIYVRAFPGPGPRATISSGGGRDPAWNPNGREIFYRAGNKLMAATVETGAAVTVRSRAALFDLNYVGGRGNRNYDVHPDGNHFLFIKTQAQQRLVVRLNALASEPR